MPDKELTEAELRRKMIAGCGSRVNTGFEFDQHAARFGAVERSVSHRRPAPCAVTTASHEASDVPCRTEKDSSDGEDDLGLKAPTDTRNSASVAQEQISKHAARTHDTGEEGALDEAFKKMNLVGKMADSVDRLDENVDGPLVPGDRVIYKNLEGFERTGVLKSVDPESGDMIVRQLGDLNTEETLPGSVRKMKLGYLGPTAASTSGELCSGHGQLEQIIFEVRALQSVISEEPKASFASCAANGNMHVVLFFSF